MNRKLQLLILIFTITFKCSAQPLIHISLNIGDPAPPLKVKAWIKGMQIEKLRNDKIYVLDFWATWCGPCLALMPHFSKLAKKYQDKVTFLSIDIYERGQVPISKIRQLVDSMGKRMDFSVGVEEGRFMSKNWADASGYRGIPTIFIVSGGKIEWTGHPKYADSVLTKILDKSWSPQFAMLKRNNQLYLRQLEILSAKELISKIVRYKVNLTGNTYDRVQISPDSVLYVIDEMVRNIPSLKFLPVFVSYTFAALLKTDLKKAYNYAQEAMFTSSHVDEPSYGILINQIEEISANVQLPENFYRLGVECVQLQIDKNPYPELGDTPGQYRKMAKLYKLAGDLPKAAEAEEKGKSFKAPVNF